MNIPTLRAYLDLAESCHFARTSERQHMSPSTLSRMIARLEDEVGSPLFERNNRSVKLTPAGAEFRQFALSTLQSWDRLQASLQRQGSDLQGEISLFCSVTASHSLLTDILGRLRARHAGVEIHLRTGDQAESLQHLLAGKEDMVIAARPTELPASVSFQQLARSRLVFIASRDAPSVNEALQHGDGQPRSVDWSQAPLILAETGLVRKHVQSWLRQHKIKAEIYAQVTGHEAIVSMVALGCGVAAVPELVLEGSAVRDSIQTLDTWPELPDFEIGLCTIKQRLDEPLIKAVWDAARE